MSATASAAMAVLSAIIIVFSAEKVVEKMEVVARSFGLSEVFIAVTLVSIGTSLPEISVHVVGSLNILSDPSLMQDLSATVLGMNIGSDIIQQTLVMGSVIAMTALMRARDDLVFTRKFITRYYVPMIAAHLLLLVAALNGFLNRLEGLMLLLAFAAYIYYLYGGRDERLLREGEAEESDRPYFDLALGFLAMAVLVYSSDVFLSIVETVVAETGISGSMIGVATVGIVSAVPEMVTALTALRQRSEGLALGTLIGSNITNPLVGIGLGAAISGYAVPRTLIIFDLPVQIATALLLVTYLWNREKIGVLSAKILDAVGFEDRAEKYRDMDRGVLTAKGGLALIGLYLVYLAVRFMYFGHGFA